MNESLRSMISAVKYPIICFLLTIMGFFLALLPVIDSGERRSSTLWIRNVPLNESFFYPQYQNALLLSAIITIPMVTDLLLDMFYVFKGNSGEILHWSIRLQLLATLTLSNIALYTLPMHDYHPSLTYLCVSTLRVITAGGCMSIFLSLDDINGSAGLKSVAILISFITGQILLLYSHLYPNNDSIFAFAFVFLAFAGLIFVQCASLSLYTYWTTEKRLTSDNVCFIFYFTATSLFSFSGLALSSTCGNFNPLNYSGLCLASLEYLQMGFLVFVMVLPGRIVRFKLDGTIRQMKERQAFMRYISHEIRTPLNTVFLGMAFVRTSLGHRPKSNNSEEIVENEILIDTVDDISNSCQTALSILNDLLTFDKIDSGQMQLEFEETHPWSYINSAVKPFSVQARQNNIRFLVACDDIETGKTIILFGKIVILFVIIIMLLNTVIL